MRRVLAALVAAGLAALAFAATGAGGGSSGKAYRVTFDNAFGLIEGGDLKIAGVRAGSITSLRLDRRTKRAVVGFEVTERGFGDLRADAGCSIAPQSLVGEYYVDCQPGKARRRLPEGATIPVERTRTTVPPDLVNNIMRRPYRERLRYIVGELGAAVAGNGENLNAALRRANPALRETNRVLRMLDEQKQVIADLARSADRVVGDLSRNRRDVARFVVEARETAQPSAERDRDIAAGFRRLPTLLRELRPTMAELGRTVDQQGPALRNLSRSAGQLRRLLDNLPPFADATRPAMRSLGSASRVGRRAVAAATPTVAELERYGRGTPELGANLATVLEHLDDRDNAAEEDPRSPGGKGYTGLEALLQYVLDQTLSINVHDGNTHILKIFAFEGECARYADIKAAREKGERCSTALGPNMIGLNFPDATAPKEGFDGADRGGPEEALRPSSSSRRARAPRTSGGASRDRGGARRPPARDPAPPAPSAARAPGLTPAPPQAPAAPKAPNAPKAPQAPVPPPDVADQLLDFLLGS